MITWYAISPTDGGSLCKCTAESWDDVNYCLFRLLWGMDENGHTFEIISKKQFKALRKSRIFHIKQILYASELNKIAGFYIEYCKPETLFKTEQYQ